MRFEKCLIAAWLILCVPVTGFAQTCDAYYSFDGNLADQGGGGYDGAMIGREGAAATAQFDAGILGQALRLDGSSAMRAYLDLNEDLCPQVSFTAWVRMDPADRITQYLFSTGAGSGPGLRTNGGISTLTATGNGIALRDTFRDVRGWFFVAGVYDYSANRYRLQFRDRTIEGELGDRRRPAEDAFWVGAYNDRLDYPVKSAWIDELRIYGRTLTTEELMRARGGRPGAVVMLEGTAGSAQAVGGGAATASTGGMPQPVPGVSDRLGTGAPRIDATDLPERPPDLLNGGLTDSASSDTPLLDTPEGLGAANDGLQDPVLTAPDDLPGDQLREATQPLDSLPTQMTPIYEETYRNDASGPVRTVEIMLPGASAAQTITYQEVDGLAIAEGDIILGSAADFSRWQRAAQPETSVTPGVRRQGLNAITNTDFLWPQGNIPYSVNSDVPQSQRTSITNAINTLNSLTNLNYVPRNGDADYVLIRRGTDPNACSSAVGRQTGRQDVWLSSSGCSVPALMHELLHAAGVWHEQSRPDRDTFVQVLTNNIQTSPNDRTFNFEKKSLDDGIGVGAYNFRSIMHYGAFAFGVACVPNPPPGATTDPNCGNCQTNAQGATVCASRTLRSRVSGTSINRDNTLASDIADIDALYPGKHGPVMGINWSNGYSGTAVAVGDIDGDGRAEVIVGRDADQGPRFYVYDDAVAGHGVLATGGDNWGSDVEVTDVAVGDVDGDGRMEIGITRKANSSNRYYIYRYFGGNLTQLHAGGDDWGSGIYATAIAFGDADGDGRDEFAVGRRAGEFGRYYLFDDGAATRPYDRLAIGGSDWDAAHYTTDVSFGDVDIDGREELGVARFAKSGMRFEIVSYVAQRLEQRFSDGDDWDSTYYATSIAIGNIDGDASGEVAVGRKAGSNSRFYLLDDNAHGFALLDSGGDLWGSNYYATGVDLADVDSDGRNELVVARNAGENSRFYVFNYRDGSFSRIPVTGAPTFSGIGATSIAAGDMDADGKADLAITYNETTSGRMRWEAIYLNPPPD